MIAEAVDAAVSVGWALVVWIVLTAVFATAALYTLVVTAACAVLAVRRGVVAALSLVQHSGGPELPRNAHSVPETPSRPAPAWARTDTEEAA